MPNSKTLSSVLEGKAKPTMSAARRCCYSPFEQGKTLRKYGYKVHWSCGMYTVHMPQTRLLCVRAAIGTCVLLIYISILPLGSADTTCIRKHYPLDAAPFFNTMQIFRMEPAQFAATACALTPATTRRTLALYAVLPRTAHFATASARSRARRRLRNHAQKRSTGLRSGDFAGIRQTRQAPVGHK